MKNPYANFQNNLNSQAGRARAGNIMDSGISAFTNALSLTRKQNRLSDLKNVLSRSYQTYMGEANDPKASELERAMARDQATNFDLFGGMLNIDNIDDASGVYKDISDITSKLNVARIRADALREITRAKNNSQQHIQRMKEQANRYQLDEGIRGQELPDYGGGAVDSTNYEVPTSNFDPNYILNVNQYLDGGY